MEYDSKTSIYLPELLWWVNNKAREGFTVHSSLVLGSGSVMILMERERAKEG